MSTHIVIALLITILVVYVVVGYLVADKAHSCFDPGTSYSLAEVTLIIVIWPLVLCMLIEVSHWMTCICAALRRLGDTVVFPPITPTPRHDEPSA